MNGHTRCAALLAASLMLRAGLGAPPEPLIPATTPPIIYTINYTDEYFLNPEYIEQFKAAPPDLLHVGKAVPITHHWGPIRLYKGENQYTGGPGHTLSWENIALLSPEALAERIETIRKTLDRYHAIGVREITPYISYHTLSGDHQKRLGFWAFYDKWDQYAQWAGPRPPHDPFDWLVVDAQGKFVGGSCGGYSPDYYAPLHRYRACINHPDWAEWHRRLIRMVAEAGYDGCFVDNCHPDPCYCRYCKAAFREFLANHRDLDWVPRLTEGLELAKLELDSPDVPAELVRRWRLLRTSDHLAMLRRVGREIRPGFTIFPNGNSIPECLTTGAQCDRLMFESTYSPGILSAGEPPATDEITITVSDGPVEPKPVAHRYSVADPATRIELEADISVPSRAQAGEPVDLVVKVATVGASDRDNDTAEDFVLLLSELESGREIRLELEPRGPLGAPGPSGEGKRPPATLKAAWTPKQPGSYAVHFGFHYTDGSTSNAHLARLVRDQLVRSHQATLQFTQHMRARSICLGYEATRSGRENVQELALAEMAAFSGGGGFSARGRRSIAPSSRPMARSLTAGGRLDSPRCSTPTGAETRSRTSVPTGGPRSTTTWAARTARLSHWWTRACRRRPGPWPASVRSTSRRRPMRCRTCSSGRFATGSHEAGPWCWPVRRSPSTAGPLPKFSGWAKTNGPARLVAAGWFYGTGTSRPFPLRRSPPPKAWSGTSASQCIARKTVWRCTWSTTTCACWTRPGACLTWTPRR
jgi:hypothetical protein